MRLSVERERAIRARIEDGAREIGVLLIVFAPLDYAFAGGAEHTSSALLFFLIGFVCFFGAVYSEVRRTVDT